MRRGFDAEYLKAILQYDPASGVFYWRIKKRRSVYIGDRAGTLHPNGYRMISIDSHHYQASHLAWLYMTGEWPARSIDHIDTDKDNNAWANLREATASQNRANTHAQANNKSGLKGVNIRGSSFRALIRKDGKLHHLGTYPTAQDAHAAYCVAAERLHGEFARSE